jgi:hypothetical protein
MNRFQHGYFSRQTALLLVLFGLVLAFAVPQLNDFSDRSKLTEAYQLASESKLRLSEFYLLSARFPSTETEMNSVTKSMFNRPEFVRAVVLDSEADEYDVVVKVYLDHDIIGSEESAEPYLFMAANRADTVGLGLDWHCGASGIDADLLPRACSG